MPTIAPRRGRVDSPQTIDNSNRKEPKPFAHFLSRVLPTAPIATVADDVGMQETQAPPPGTAGSKEWISLGAVDFAHDTMSLVNTFSDGGSTSAESKAESKKKHKSELDNATGGKLDNNSTVVVTAMMEEKDALCDKVDASDEVGREEPTAGDCKFDDIDDNGGLSVKTFDDESSVLSVVTDLVLDKGLTAWVQIAVVTTGTMGGNAATSASHLVKIEEEQEQPTRPVAKVPLINRSMARLRFGAASPRLTKSAGGKTKLSRKKKIDILTVKNSTEGLMKSTVQEKPVATAAAGKSSTEKPMINIHNMHAPVEFESTPTKNEASQENHKSVSAQYERVIDLDDSVDFDDSVDLDDSVKKALTKEDKFKIISLGEASAEENEPANQDVTTPNMTELAFAHQSIEVDIIDFKTALLATSASHLVKIEEEQEQPKRSAAIVPLMSRSMKRLQFGAASPSLTKSAAGKTKLSRKKKIDILTTKNCTEGLMKSTVQEKPVATAATGKSSTEKPMINIHNMHAPVEFESTPTKNEESKENHKSVSAQYERVIDLDDSVDFDDSVDLDDSVKKALTKEDKFKIISLGEASADKNEPANQDVTTPNMTELAFADHSTEVDAIVFKTALLASAATQYLDSKSRWSAGPGLDNAPGGKQDNIATTVVAAIIEERDALCDEMDAGDDFEREPSNTAVDTRFTMEKEPSERSLMEGIDPETRRQPNQDELPLCPSPQLQIAEFKDNFELQTHFGEYCTEGMMKSTTQEKPVATAETGKSSTEKPMINIHNMHALAEVESTPTKNDESKENHKSLSAQYGLLFDLDDSVDFDDNVDLDDSVSKALTKEDKFKIISLGEASAEENEPANQEVTTPNMTELAFADHSTEVDAIVFKNEKKVDEDGTSNGRDNSVKYLEVKDSEDAYSDATSKGGKAILGEKIPPNDTKKKVSDHFMGLWKSVYNYDVKNGIVTKQEEKVLRNGIVKDCPRADSWDTNSDDLSSVESGAQESATKEVATPNKMESASPELHTQSSLLASAITQAPFSSEDLCGETKPRKTNTMRVINLSKSLPLSMKKEIFSRQKKKKCKDERRDHRTSSTPPPIVSDKPREAHELKLLVALEMYRTKKAEASEKRDLESQKFAEIRLLKREIKREMKQLTALRKSKRAIDETTRKNMIDEKKAELAYATTKHKKAALASSIAEAEVALARDGAMRALEETRPGVVNDPALARDGAMRALEEKRTGVVNDPRADSWDTNSEDVTSIESDDATEDVQETVGSFVQKFALGLWCGDSMGDGESTTMSGENMGDGESTLMTGETSHSSGSTSQRGASQDEDD